VIDTPCRSHHALILRSMVPGMPLLILPPFSQVCEGLAFVLTEREDPVKVSASLPVVSVLFSLAVSVEVHILSSSCESSNSSSISMLVFFFSNSISSSLFIFSHLLFVLGIL